MRSRGVDGARWCHIMVSHVGDRPQKHVQKANTKIREVGVGVGNLSRCHTCSPYDPHTQKVASTITILI